jgi:hypothetical protein
MACKSEPKFECGTFVLRCMLNRVCFFFIKNKNIKAGESQVTANAIARKLSELSEMHSKAGKGPQSAMFQNYMRDELLSTYFDAYFAKVTRQRCGWGGKGGEDGRKTLPDGFFFKKKRCRLAKL